MHLQPSDVGALHQLLEANEDSQRWSYGRVDVDLVNDVEIGDNFMIPADEDNDEGVDFYILQCQGAKFEVLEEFQDSWGGGRFSSGRVCY